MIGAAAHSASKADNSHQLLIHKNQLSQLQTQLDDERREDGQLQAQMFSLQDQLDAPHKPLSAVQAGSQFELRVWKGARVGYFGFIPTTMESGPARGCT